MSLDIKDVISAARSHLMELLPDAEDGDPRMEEIERQGANWAVTYSFLAPGRSSTTSHLVGPRSPFGLGRIAKVIIVNGQSGDFVALKQRAA